MKNRIKVLESVQRRAQRAVQVARLKAKKLQEIEQLKELENTQQRVLLQSDHNREMQLIAHKSKSIGSQERERVAINSIYDNTINAIKLRMQKQQHIEQIVNDKKLRAIENEVRRNRILAMERASRQRMQDARLESTAKIRRMRVQYYRDMRQRVGQAQGQLKDLESVERRMVTQIQNTVLRENAHIQLSLGSGSNECRGRIVDSLDSYKTIQ